MMAGSRGPPTATAVESDQMSHGQILFVKREAVKGRC